MVTGTEPMKFDNAELADDARSLLAVVRGSCTVRNRGDFVDWLQGEIQEFIPHQIVILAWGRFETGEFTFDIIPTASGLGAFALGPDQIRQLLAATFRKWLAFDQAPVQLDLAGCVSYRDDLRCAAPKLTVAVAHGLKDRRGRYDCLYVFLGGPQLARSRVHERLQLLLSSIDVGSRKALSLEQPVLAEPTPRARAAVSSRERSCSELSAREIEVMGWVRMGKTNPEIATIMNLSTFTIKNHMRRIYRKLDVLNRAQAVGRLGQSVVL